MHRQRIVGAAEIIEERRLGDLVISRGTTIGLRCMRQRRIQLRTVHALTDMQLLLIRCSAADQLDAALPRLADALDRCVDGACS